MFIYLFIYLSENMSYIYIRTLAAQQGHKTLTVACLKTKRSTINDKNLEKSTEFSEFLKLHNVLKFTAIKYNKHLVKKLCHVACRD